ncbi:MAG TPA: class I SAM-dependent methyltransferase [Thermomicrobiaceae bacterium]|nr:class I SAM-dependent methyltransferase [Thermomicrobiaceae bacterium]
MALKRYGVRAREVSPWLDRFDEVFQPGPRTLELGCGLGHDAGDLGAVGLKVVALDCERARVALAREEAPTAALLVADLARSLPFPGGAFDLVVASLSLHYFDQASTGRIVTEIARVLRPEGQLLCRVNAIGDVLHRYGQGIELEPGLFEVTPGRTKRFFTPESLAAFLQPSFAISELMPRLAWTEQGEKRTLECLARRRD